ncbi:MAG: c-type cytochrome domain-containing protein [Gemmataceae bacterium]
MKGVGLVTTAVMTIIGPLGMRSAAADNSLASRANKVLETHCYRCHGKDGSLEGGMSYILDRDKLIARKKIISHDAASSALYKRVAGGKMPPPEEALRPTKDEIRALREWIDAGAPRFVPAVERPVVNEGAAYAAILADLENVERRSRRFTRYFSVVHFYNEGLSDDELQTYRSAVSKLLNSLSWRPRITAPKPIDQAQTIYRIDLRDYMWDANIWNRLLAEYPYGIAADSAVARACSVATGTRLPVLRADWFIASASRPPLYYDVLQIPTSANELERQLRIDVGVDIQQERVARAGFNGSGVSRNNRLIERHDSVHGAYWRTYDFDEVKQNLTDRDNLLPDRRNLFAYPLGPGTGDNTFQHAGGEIIFNLPNGLQAYMLVNAVNDRVNKAPTAIVSDPRRPDRAVEPGISCMSCHLPGIIQKADQIRDHVAKNPKQFSKAAAELIGALYPPEKKMKGLMDEDAERYQKALEKTGVRLGKFEPISTLTLRYEADVDLATAAAELGVKPDDLLKMLDRGETIPGNAGALKIAGGTVSRSVFIQTFADLVRSLHSGTPLQPGVVSQSLPDNTGEIDPLEGPSNTSNAVAFTPDGRFALFASADRSLRLWDIEGGHETRRFVGHSASVLSVSLSPDGKQALSGSTDASVRLWDVDSGRELLRLQGHEGPVMALAISPDGKRSLSGGYDHQVFLWNLETGKEIRHWPVKNINALCFAATGTLAAVASLSTIRLFNLETAKEVGNLEGHQDSVTTLAFSKDGKRLLSGSDDGTVRLWDVASAKEIKLFKGHENGVKCVALSADGRRLASGGADHTVRLWDTETGKELGKFTKHADLVSCVRFITAGRQIVSGSRDSAVLLWNLP